MKNLKNKKGISLIVLILTIIVMIILATAIILSLSNSGIIGKANKAKQDSDTASLKEYVNILKAEWELMSETERGDYDTSAEYVNAKLEAEGYNRMLNDDGVLLTEGATLAIKAGLEIGDEVTGYNELLKAKSDEDNKFDTDGNENTAENAEGQDWTDTPSDPQIVKANTDMKWYYMGVTEDGNIQILPDVSNATSEDYKITLSGSGGVNVGPTTLNNICAKIYKTSKGEARSINIEDVITLLGYNGPVYHGGVSEIPDQYVADSWYNLVLKYKTDDYLYPSNFLSWGIADSDLAYRFRLNKDSATITNTIGKDLIFTTFGAYWVATKSLDISMTNSYVNVGVFSVGVSVVSGCEFVCSLHYAGGSASYLVRPIVTLNSDVTLEKTTDGNWKIN